MTPTTFIILMLSFMMVALIRIWFEDNKKENQMANSSDELFTQKIEKLQDDYGALKINSKEFTEGLNLLGIYTAEEVEGYMEAAETARYEFKLDGVKPTTTVDDIAMPFPEIPTEEK